MCASAVVSCYEFLDELIKSQKASWEQERRVKDLLIQSVVLYVLICLSKFLVRTCLLCEVPAIGLAAGNLPTDMTP